MRYTRALWWAALGTEALAALYGILWIIRYITDTFNHDGQGFAAFFVKGFHALLFIFGAVVLVPAAAYVVGMVMQYTLYAALAKDSDDMHFAALRGALRERQVYWSVNNFGPRSVFVHADKNRYVVQVPTWRGSHTSESHPTGEHERALIGIHWTPDEARQSVDRASGMLKVRGSVPFLCDQLFHAEQLVVEDLARREKGRETEAWAGQELTRTAPVGWSVLLGTMRERGGDFDVVATGPRGRSVVVEVKSNAGRPRVDDAGHFYLGGRQYDHVMAQVLDQKKESQGPVIVWQPHASHETLTINGVPFVSGTDGTSVWSLIQTAP